MKTLYLCGGGNAEGVRLALAINRNEHRWERLLLLDDDPARHGQTQLGVPIVGGFEELRNADHLPGGDEVANLVARTTAKRRAARERIASFGIPFAQLLSPGIDTLGAVLADDVMAYHNAILGPEITIGSNTVVFMGGIVGHECTVGRSCVIAANAVLNARVVLEDEVYIGTNATVLPEVTIGTGATVAAGSVVIADVPAGATAIGVPAQVMATEAAIGTMRLASMGATPSTKPTTANTRAPAALERDIARIWGAVLQRETVDPEQTFFDLGGDSLLALRVCEQLKQETGINLCIMDVYQYPTVQALARRFQQELDGDDAKHLDDGYHDRAARRRKQMLRRAGHV